MSKHVWWAVAVILLALVTVGVRTYHVGEWLHYELDQARDFRIISAAIQYGPGELPLQGPKAAGNVLIRDADTGELTDKTTLRLGPLFYYIEYASALIFGATPLGAVMLIIILSILTVPVFYVFLRRLFSPVLAWGGSALMAVSLFFVTYSRFGWNPNLLPVFLLVFALALLYSVDTTRSPRVRGWSLVVAAIAMAAAGQMHFLAFTTAPVIGVMFLLLTHRRVFSRQYGIAWRYIAGAILAFVLLQTPLIINDIKTGGENTKAFVAALTQKSSKEQHSLLEKTIRNTGNHIKYAWLILTGDQRAEVPQYRRGDIICDYSCRKGIVRGGISALLLAAGAVIMIREYRRCRDKRRRDAIRLVALWGGVVFLAYIPLSYSMAPRFFLVHGPVAIVLFLFIIQAIAARSRSVGYGILALALASNAVFVWNDFSQRAAAARGEDVRIQTDYVLKEKTRMPLVMMERIIEHIRRRHEQTGYPVWLHGQAEFKRAFWERLDSAGIARFSASKHLETAPRDGLYFIIVRTQSDQEAYLSSIMQNATVADRVSFGTLTLYELRPLPHVITSDPPSLYVQRRDPQFSSNAQVRYLWRQVFDDETKRSD